MAKSFDLLKHYPDRWRNLKEIQAICDSDLLSVDDEDVHTLPHLWRCMEAELNNAFILPYEDKEGADEYACSRWEKMLGIVPANDMTLDDRQFNVYTKLFQNTPYSIGKLKQMLDYLIGEGDYALMRDVTNKTIVVKLSLASRFKADAVQDLLDKIVPADMILNITVAYTTHDDMGGHTHDELSAYTHDDIKLTEL